MATLTFHGATGEIGGNKVLLDSGKARIFLDFGKNFGREKAYYDPPYLEPRRIEHLLGLGILPDVQGLYEGRGKEAGVDGVLLSHPHTDHTDHARWLRNDIPLYCGATAKEIIVAREFSGRPKYAYIAKLSSSSHDVYKTFETFRTGSKVKFDGIEATPVHVDHSTPGAYGFLLETKGARVAYTGDLRLHGHKWNMTGDFLAAAERFEPDALVIEGTNVGAAHVSSEDEVCAKVCQLVADTKGLAFGGFAPIDVDRLRTFHAAARKAGRKLVITSKQAYLLHALRHDEGLDIFRLDDESVLVFRKEKSRTDQWEKDLEAVVGDRLVCAEDVAKAQGSLLFVCNYYDFNELVEIDPMPGSTYVLSSSEPFDEEGELDRAKLENWLEHFGVPLYQVHASGHASAHELKAMIARIRPKKVFTIHTERPELYARYIRDLGIETVAPVEGRAYEV